jgi:hypothetical protein
MQIKCHQFVHFILQNLSCVFYKVHVDSKNTNTYCFVCNVQQYAANVT